MYDAVIIGAGPGGYACAIRIAQLGGSVVLIEKDELGGCCANYGCIPTKALYESAKFIDRCKRSKRLGIDLSYDINFDEIVKRKERIVRTGALGIARLLESFGIDVIKGVGKIVDVHTVEANSKTLEAKNIVIATGSAPFTIPGVEIDHDIVIDSTDILGMRKLPKDMVICGGGVIGVELASIFAQFGAQITVVEMLPNLIAGQDIEISDCLKQMMERAGINILLNTKVQKVSGNVVEVMTENKKSELSAGKILIVFGRRPVFDKKELDQIGVKYERGISVNSRMQTNVKNIYAVGDVTNMIMLAHVASAQGEVAAENIMGVASEMDYGAVPNCIFTFPQIGSVGAVSQGLKDVKIGKFPFAASGKARTADEISGFIKVISKDNILIGVHMIGPDVTELIAEAVLAVKNKLDISQITDTIHAHPTLSESFLEAVRDLNNESINLPKK